MKKSYKKKILNAKLERHMTRPHVLSYKFSKLYIYILIVWLMNINGTNWAEIIEYSGSTMNAYSPSLTWIVGPTINLIQEFSAFLCTHWKILLHPCAMLSPCIHYTLMHAHHSIYQYKSRDLLWECMRSCHVAL